MKLTIYFDGSFWYGLIEYQERNKLLVYKHMFGRAPKDAEVLDFIDYELTSILVNSRFSDITESVEETKKINPKRMQRLINRQKKQTVISTKSQDAMREIQDSLKIERKQISKAEKERLKQEKFDKAQLKKLKKRKGH
ncbi:MULTISPECIES: YjdF family protein [Vagococcus]|uniref:DUF2992 domain-containing protein n=1 Tax=Vagococcus fluvialis bH819 TaxID=1255619 RepID=A0A1X6WMC4_9ENTE|nr:MULTISPECIES: YjdF family protein [Vagococcus]SLM85417.1 hypothetical protein FM121_04915 [Vagococcus fluvialis bH819]HCM89290.1 DUF2992 domain-containing protein [Vagococcus sp.]